MPQTTSERAARWPGMDRQAIDYLKQRGYTLQRSWHWHAPDLTHIPTDKERDAILYLIEEWDFGGLING